MTEYDLYLIYQNQMAIMEAIGTIVDAQQKAFLGERMCETCDRINTVFKMSEEPE